MKPVLNRKFLQNFLVCVMMSTLLTACAPSVKVRSDADPSVSLTQYQTYGFFSQMGIEDDNYSNLLGQHFRETIASQMDRRGFTQSASPQLQVNVSIGSKDKVRVNTYQDPYLYAGDLVMQRSSS